MLAKQESILCNFYLANAHVHFHLLWFKLTNSMEQSPS
jgi:hypothetical protein